MTRASPRRAALLLAPVVIGATLAVVTPIRGDAQEVVAGEWIAGDLHVHTTYSHDSYGGPTDDNTGPDEAHTLGYPVAGQFALAATRGLDYLAITDHNDVRSVSDPGFGAAGVIPVPGYENSLRGHAQMLGAIRLYDNGDRSADAVERIADELRADGGVFQVNHPADGSTDFPNDSDWEYLYEVVPDTVEVWNISRLYQPPGPSGSSNDDAVRYWEGWLDRGHRVGATGGSDSHWVSTSAVQGVGQPTTWVFVTERSAAGVLEGLRAGRTFITHQPPNYRGPRVFLEADAEGDGEFESMVGDAVPPGSTLRVRIEGAPGSFVRVVTTGSQEAFAPVPVVSASFTHEFTQPEGTTWARAEIFEPDARAERSSLCDDELGSETTYCRNHLLILAMTSAIYFQPESIATALDYVGDERGLGETVHLAARLTTLAGEPVVGRTVAFEIAEQMLFATTDVTGLAEATASVPDHGRSLEVRAVFAGDDVYLPSEDFATITWGGGPPPRAA
ncbi:MAG: CehA/McbA family metallohydrolase [Actinomycetota bacterium]